MKNPIKPSRTILETCGLAFITLVRLEAVPRKPVIKLPILSPRLSNNELSC